MVRRPLIIISISLVVLAVVSIFTWLIFFSIYEVKYIHNFNAEELVVNSKNCIECFGINSLGQKIRYRDLDFKVTLKDSEDKVELIENEDKNRICFKTIQPGETSFSLSSKYSLNPSLLRIKINKK